MFRFKQFEVDQEDCAMKINTDGVLLGAIADGKNVLRILDIGTGTGVIALMLAQRFTAAQVDAVEIDEPAALRAAANFDHSVFAGRLKAYCMDIRQYAPGLRYDLMVSNPPFFVNDLKNPEKRKGLARHADESFFELLLDKAASLLTEKGCFWLILPVKQAEWVVAHAVLHQLFACVVVHVYSDKGKPEFRRMVCLSFERGPVREEHFYIYESKGLHTAAYQHLLKDFFLGL